MVVDLEIILSYLRLPSISNLFTDSQVALFHLLSSLEFNFWLLPVLFYFGELNNIYRVSIMCKGLCKGSKNNDTWSWNSYKLFNPSEYLSLHL